MHLDDVSWQDLAVLLSAFEHGSLNQAARALHIGQSTASRRLARLERTLGTRLFDRTPEGLRPTAFAESLLPHAQLIADRMADIARLASGQAAGVSGRIRIALPAGVASHAVLPRLHTYLDAYPEVAVDLVVGQAVVDLLRREADLAIRFVRPTNPDLVVAKLTEMHPAPYVHPSVPGPPGAMRWVTFDDPGQRYQETRWIAEHVAPERTMRISTWHAMVAAITAGLGAGLLAPPVAEAAGLRRVEGLPEVPSRQLYLVYHRALRDVPRIATFRRWLLAELPRWGAGAKIRLDR
jgi:DNA-binding transcriptional LysR family regulator